MRREESRRGKHECSRHADGSLYALRRGVKFSEAEFMQYRKCVGGGPSSKTCPRCASQRVHCTSSRTMPSEVSRCERTFSLAIGCQKLGQPVPDSNLVFESKSTVSQHMQLYRPSAWLLAYLPVPGRSVPACLVTSNCSGVSCFFHSASDFSTFSTSTTPVRITHASNSTIRTVFFPVVAADAIRRANAAGTLAPKSFKNCRR